MAIAGVIQCHVYCVLYAVFVVVVVAIIDIGFVAARGIVWRFVMPVVSVTILVSIPYPAAESWFQFQGLFAAILPLLLR